MKIEPKPSDREVLAGLIRSVSLPPSHGRSSSCARPQSGCRCQAGGPRAANVDASSSCSSDIAATAVAIGAEPSAISRKLLRMCFLARRFPDPPRDYPAAEEGVFLRSEPQLAHPSSAIVERGAWFAREKLVHGQQVAESRDTSRHQSCASLFSLRIGLRQQAPGRSKPPEPLLGRCGAQRPNTSPF